MIENSIYSDKQEYNRIRKNNARLYPIYKMFSWDLLFYYAIAFVFLTQTKGLSIATVLLTDSIFPIFKIILQLPASSIIDRSGKRKSLILANILLAISLFFLIIANSIYGILVSYFFMAFAFAIKNVAENNLLFDSVTVKNHHDLYTRIDEKGSSNYYYLDGISSLITGFLYVINGYIPMLISLGFVIISIALSTCFKDIYPSKKELSFKKRLQEYSLGLKDTFRYIFSSKRLKALFLFASFFSGLIYIIGTYREGMLVFLDVPAQYFSVIIAVLTFICGLATAKANKVHEHFRNKTFTFMIGVYATNIILTGIISFLPISSISKLICILALFAVTYMIEGPYYVLRDRYLKSFATPDMRVKIDTTYTLIRSISEFACAFLASFLLDQVNVTYAYLYTGFLCIALSFILIQYMKPRFGLSPEQYTTKDIQTLETK